MYLLNPQEFQGEKFAKLSELNTQEISSLVIIGGFGAAKNLSNWAFKGPNGSVINDVKKKTNCFSLYISNSNHCIDNKKQEINYAISSLVSIDKTTNELCYDEKLKIITVI